LGEQQYFVANSKSHGVSLLIFDDEDVRAAFKQAAGKGKSSLPNGAVKLFLDKLYAGPIQGDNDEELLRAFLGDQEELLLEDLLDAVRQAQDQIRETQTCAPNICYEYDSNKAFRDAGKQLKHNPNDKYVNPVTASMEYGWQEDTKFAMLDKQITKRYPKRASPETRFADAMAADGAL
jgi:hypothetical protein